MFVTNGGWGGVLAALAAGVPVVVAPGTAADKPEVARRVARSGAGVDLRRRQRNRSRRWPTPYGRCWRSPRITAAGRSSSAAELAGCGGAGSAADLLEALAIATQ